MRPASASSLIVCAVLLLGMPAAAAARPGAGAGSAAGTITTIAGGPGGPALARDVALFDVCGVSYANDTLYISDLSPVFSGYSIRAISTLTWRLRTLAGAAGSGSAADGSLASGGISGTVCGVAADHHGNLLFTQSRGFTPPVSNRVRVVPAVTGTYYGQSMLAGHVYTIAGGFQPGFSGDGGPAADARLDRPSAITVDAAGNVLFADNVNNRVRVIAAASGRYYGVPMTAGDIYTVAGDGNGTPSAASGGLATATTLGLHDAVDTGGVRIDHFGNLVIADPLARVIQIVPAASGTYYGQAMTAGHIYTVAGTPPGHAGMSCGNTGSGGPALRARLCPVSVAVDRTGNLVIAGDNLIWVSAAASGTFYGRTMRAGHIYRVATTADTGQSGTGSRLAVDGAFNVVFTSASGHPGSSLAGAVDVLAASNDHDFGVAMRAGRVYQVAGNGWLNYSGDGGPARIAQLGSNYREGGLSGSGGVGGLAVGSRGNIIIADSDNFRVRVLATSTGRFYGRRMVEGRIYTIAGTGVVNGRGVGKHGRVTGPAAGTQVWPTGIAADPQGDLAVSGQVGGTGQLWLLASRSGVRFGQHLTAGDVAVLARCPGKNCYKPAQPAFDAAGNVIFDAKQNTKAGIVDHVYVVAVRAGTFYNRRMLAGHTYVLAGRGLSGDSGDGGPATAAEVRFGPVAVDHHGNVLLDMPGGIRVIAAGSGTFYGTAMTAGDIYTVAAGCCGSQVFGPASMAVDAAGNVLVSDTDTHQVKVLAASTGTFYGVPMIKGQVVTIAGTGTKGFSGDGGSAIDAELGGPGALAITASGAVLVGDLLRIREITP